MNRTVDLGALGEAAAERLFDGVELGSGFEPYLLTSPHPKALAELRRRLAAEEGPMVVWRPSVELAQALPEKCAALPVDGVSRPRIWIETENFDPVAWRAFLRSLNFQRDRLIRLTPVLWVLAGPPELQSLFQESALDLATGTKQLSFPEEPKPLATYGTPSPIRWWHLSDFHFKAEERWDRRNTLQALLRLAEEEVAAGHGPHLVFLTGDIAFSGKTAEYQQALAFLRELGMKLGLQPREHFFVVPGNHDVDRARVARGEKILVDNLESQEDIEGIFADAATLGMLGRRLEAFYGFTSDLLGPARAWQPTRPWRVDVPEVGGIRLGILQLNSAWTCGPGEGQGTVWIGSPQVEEALQLAADALVRVVLVHHPIADLADADRAALETRFTAPDGAHFLLRGHLHRGRSMEASSPDGRLFELAAGALYTDDPGYPRGFFSTQVDLADGRATFKSWGYEAGGRGFWHPKGIYENARDGVWTAELPPQLRLGASSAPTVLTEARRDILSARYREAAAAYHGRLRFIGFADSRPRPTARVPELFVPLRLKAEVPTEGKKLSTLDLLCRLSSRDAEPARIVVLGGPGSGKTTLSTFATVAMAGEAQLGGLDIPEDLLPLLLPFRDYVASSREQKDRSILEFLKAQASTELQLSLPESFLEKALEERRAVLILDGLDEVGSQDERVTMLKRVEAFCSAWKNLPILVTSRITGYDDAPLPRGRGGFEHFLLEEFDSEDQQSFVRNWYEIQEPDDPVARERGIHELTLAITEDPSVGALARSPILATLIALVHRYEAHLPGERALLYDLCVKTLLETWPAARRRTFPHFDARLQRTYLEEVAFRIHEYRSAGKSISVPFRQMSTTIAQTLRFLRGINKDEATLLADHWLNYLIKDTGLLVEEQPGYVGFLHLSLYEFLASRGWERHSQQPHEITLRFLEPGWREICLLMVGYRSSDKNFLDALFESFCKNPTLEGWSFLFHCLREEAAFNNQQIVKISSEAAKAFLDGALANRHILNQLTNLSQRNGPRVVKWLRDRLKYAREGELRAVAALSLEQTAELAVLGERADTSQVAADLLEFWPLPLGIDAARDATPQSRVDWGIGAKGIASTPRVLKALSSISMVKYVHGGLLLSLYINAARAVSTLQIEQTLSNENTSNLLIISPGSQNVPLHPLGYGMLLSPLRHPGYSDYGTHEYLIFLELDDDFLNYGELGRVHRIFSRGLTKQHATQAAHYFRSKWQIEIKDDEHSVPSLIGANIDERIYFSWGSTIERPSPLATRPPRCKFSDEQQIGRSRAIGEALAAFSNTRNQEPLVALAHAHNRLTNLATLKAWPKLEQAMAVGLRQDYALLSLYFSLGWSQANTTWEWPDSLLWRALLAASPPPHWMPRSQWYFCWLLYQPQNVEYRQGFDDALKEGLSDSELPGLAAEIRRIAIPQNTESTL